MFRKQTAKNMRQDAAIETEEGMIAALPNLGVLQDGYHGGTLVALTVKLNTQGDGFMALAKVHLSTPLDTVWAELGYEAGPHVIWGHGATIMQAIAAIEVALRDNTASLVPDKYAGDAPRTPLRGSNRVKKSPGGNPMR